MQEGAIMEIGKWFLSLSFIFVLISVAVFGIQYGQAVNFKQHVNYTIERNGGLTSTAVTEIKNYSKDNYDSRFTISSSQLNTKVKFGETVNYTVTGEFGFTLFPLIPTVKMKVGEGQATSLIR